MIRWFSPSWRGYALRKPRLGDAICYHALKFTIYHNYLLPHRYHSPSHHNHSLKVYYHAKDPAVFSKLGNEVTPHPWTPNVDP